MCFDVPCRRIQREILSGIGSRSLANYEVQVRTCLICTLGCLHLSVDLHNPPESVAKKLGYPLAVVKHAEARDRAMRRFKNPGEK